MKKFLFVGLFCLFLGAVVFLLTKQAPSQQTAVPKTNEWKGIVPGKTVSKDLYAQLGQPTMSSSSGEQTTLFYPSTNQYWNNDVVIRQNTVAFIKEWVFPIEQGSFSSRKKDLTGEAIRLFGPDTASNIYLFVYSSDGLAFLADPDKDVVYQVWHFSPTTIQDFLLLPEAEGFFRTQPPGADI